MNGGVWEIEEEEDENFTRSNDHSNNVPSSLSRRRWSSAAGGEEDVYVAVGKKKSSMEALSWALKHIAGPSTFVYLVHVFPQVHHIPTPLGMLPKSQVTAEQVEMFMSQERARRIQLLQKFLNLCHASKVQVDTVLIESDLVAKAVTELIPVLNIKMIVVGTTKSSMRKMKKGNSKGEQIYKSAPDYCEVKIICDGKEVTTTDQLTTTASPSQHSDNSGTCRMRMKDDKQDNGKKKSPFRICFSGKAR